MVFSEQIEQFTSALDLSLSSKNFVKVSLGNYKGNEEALKQILVRPVLIKRESKLAFTFRYKTRDVVKNLDLNEGINLVSEYLTTGFKIGTLFTTERDLILEELNNGKIVLRKKNGD
jgi:hypothetical protein